MPTESVNRLELQARGFIDQQIAMAQSWIETRLRKRYAIPFAAPYPEIYLGWITAIVTLAAYQRRGWNPSGAENELIIKAADDARAEVKEAADSKDGMFELPLRHDAPAGAVTQGGPMAYSEVAPYTWIDRQAEVARGE